MNNGLLFLGGLLVAILAALFAVPHFVDWNSYRGVFEEEASKVLGRDVRVGGSVNLKILPVPYVRFEKLRIASVSGQTGEPFIRADSFTMWLSVGALLRGVLEASQVELEKPVLSLSVDDAGVGNWAKLELIPGDLPFVPRDVALRSVEITDGAISVYNATSERVATVDSIDGEFSADGLRGPFRFKGTSAWGGSDHEVKFATDIPASDGAFALKLSAKAERSPNIFMLDGRVYNISEKASFKGRWSGKLQVPGGDTVAAPGKAPTPLIDLQSDVTADAQGAKFQNLSLALANAAEAQSVTGSAAVSWSASPRLDLTLNSKWLNVDWLAGAGQGSASFEALKQLALGLMQSVSGDSRAAAKINLEQVKIGGENAGGLLIDADRQGSITRLKTFRVSLPGGSRLDLSGDLKTKSGKLSFAGNGFIGGSSFGRFKAWADKSGIPIDVDADGPYSAAGKIEIDDKRFFLTEASGDISGRALAGELKITNDERKRTDLTLQAAVLDTREVFPKVASALQAEFRKSLGLAPNPNEVDPRDALPGDVRLRVIAGRLTDGDDVYRDVDVSFAIDGQTVTLPVAKLTTQNGLAIGLEGRIETRENGPIGTVGYDVVGTTPDAMQDLVRKAGLLGIVGEERLKGLKDGKIAGLVRLGAQGPKTTDVTFDGLVNGSHLNGRAEFDGGFENWRSRPSRLQALLDAPSLSALRTTLGLGGRDIAADAQQPVRASLIAVGTLATGSEAQAAISAQDFDLSFRGRTQWPENSELALNGSVDIKTAQARDALAVTGVVLPGGIEGVSAGGTLDVGRDGSSWTITTQNFSLGASTLAGRVTGTSDAGGLRINGDVLADRVTAWGLLAPVSGALSNVEAASAGSAANGGATPRSIWPEGLFDFATLGNTQAILNVGFKSLQLSGGLATGNGKMTVALTPGKLAVSDLDAIAAGGQLAGRLRLEKALNGVALAAALQLDQAKISSFSAGAKGTATVDLNVEARAQSPAGLMAVMSGSGTAKLVGAELSGPAPEAVAGVVDDVLNGRAQNDPEALAAALVAAVGTSRMQLGSRDLALSVADGALKISKIDLDSADGKVEGVASADLATLGTSASFQLTPVVRPLPPLVASSPNPAASALKGPLPSATLLYSGQLDNLAAVSVKADVADLQRELVVRQMERNVEELEQARKADEERARVERERRKKEAADRAAAQQKEMQQMPPVIPESAGTANPAGGRNGADPNSGFPSGSSEPADGRSGDPVLTPNIIVEPLPPPAAASASQGGAGDAIAVDPETGLPIPKPAPAVRPSAVRTSPPLRQRRRTSSDEVMKTLGGFQ